MGHGCSSGLQKKLPLYSQRTLNPSFSFSLNFSESKLLLILPSSWTFVLQGIPWGSHTCLLLNHPFNCLLFSQKLSIFCFWLKLESCGLKGFLSSFSVVIMHNSDQDNQDQRTAAGMEDPATTIEFLRARLLSERCISKSARQRADELARRVEALEEQLKIVSLQRKKAEKATADVLAILENNGISDSCESFDSSSDQETPSGSKADNGSTKEEENSVNSTLRRNESGELSGSDIDFSPEPRRALSWKGRKGSKHSPEKYKDSYRRRGSSFASISSSPKHRAGRSCRQIRRKESRSTFEEVKTDAIKVDSQEQGVAVSLEVSPNDSDGRPECLRGASQPREEKLSLDGPHMGCLDNGTNVSCCDVDFNGHPSDNDMEKALEQQAQLIGKYEEMEKTQREWEERFRENNSSTPDSCDPGNQSDITEEREEIKVQALCPVDTTNFELAKSKVEGIQFSNELTKVEGVQFANELSKTQSNGFVPPRQNDMQCLEDQKCCSSSASDSVTQEFAFPTVKEKHNQENLENGHYQPSHSSHNHLGPHGSPGNQSPNIVSSNTSCSSSRGDVSGSPNELCALVPHEPSNGFNGVLESLKQAKLSLRQKMSRSSSTATESVGIATKPAVPAFKFGDRAEIPVGFGGLFRLPTDFAIEASKANFLESGSQSTLANYYPNSGLWITAHDQTLNNSYISTRSTYSADNLPVAADSLPTRPYTGLWSSYSMDDRLCSSPYRETQSGAFSQRPTFDRNLEVGVPSSNQYTHPTYSSYPDLIQGVPVNEAFPTFRPTSSVGIPPTNHSSFYNDHSRPNMYR